ncbi:hypothetical protein P7D22_21920 [Lichenihabitans sp. Uapishka_5]|uniref:hypothetical protein n=1 Tax=Lichenihabitans sp. Uapishka_5 TaxID=3037302 RepID=UPI0029E7ED13|nr:hypothetical protein [Lichenihabitans sp. Uapishka_5]MDX7953824.1 hypothetical protein [Lichenihabitans sp. Uapishka_5]
MANKNLKTRQGEYFEKQELVDISDPIALLEETRAKFKADSRKAIYDLIQAGTAVVLFMKSNPKEAAKLLRHSFFDDMHVRPKEVCKAAMQLAMGAKTDNQREQANRFGRAIDQLLKEGESVEGIADRLARSGGVRAVLVQAKSDAIGVKAEPEAQPKTRLSAKRQLPVQADDEGELSLDDVVDENSQDEDENESGRPVPMIGSVESEEPVILEVACTTSELQNVLSAQEALLKVRIKRVRLRKGRKWYPVLLSEHTTLK